MTPLFTKLNLGAHRSILVLNAPESFEMELQQLTGVDLRRVPPPADMAGFMIVFVRTLREVSAAAELISAVAGDPVIWLAYPKASSKRYECEFNRDTGWAAVRAVGFNTVRQVAIDADWSALRFRRPAFIKRMV